MSKLRVYEYAKKQGMNSKEILEILRRLDVPIRNHMSVMEGDSIEKVEKYMERLKSGATKDVKATPKAQKEAPTPTPTQSRAPQQGVARQNAPTQSRAPQQGVARQNAPSQSRAPQQGATKQNAPTPSRAPQQSRAPKQNSAPRKNQSSFQDTPQKEKMPRPMKTNEDNNQSKSKVEARPQFQDKDKRKGQSQQGPQNQGQPKQGRPQQGRPQQGRPQQGQSGQRRGRGSGKRGRSNQQERTEPVTKISQKVVEHITITGSLSVAELAHKMHKEPSEIIKKLMLLGTMATINQELEAELVHVIAGEYGMTVEEKIPVDETIFEQIDDTDEPEKLKERGPVVTVMGHVDHGKTTLLDAIRQTNVTASEAGGITQHIGAYQVDYNKKKITFLDTPGHEAFTTMRARGAKVTDVAIIVVAADDGVMPQTREAISHAQAAHVPIIVAVNKMDKPDVNPDKVKQELMEMKLVPEEWGGDTIFVPVSALNKEGMDDLMEMVMLVSEVEELRANPDKLARGTVIDAELDKGKGPIATILIQSGTLKIGDPIVVGTTYGRVRAMMNDQGRRIKTATPSTPVAILGLHDVPHAGDQFKVFDDEKKARIIGESRASKLKESEQKSVGKISLDELFEQIQQGEVKELNIIIKADVHGSADAMKSSLEKIEVEDIKVKIIHTGVGAINESDVTLAAASNAIIIGFNVRPQPQAKQVADREKVDIRLHRVIYNVTEEIESAMKGLLDPEFEEKVIGTAEVRQIFKVSKVGTIAGSYVKEGFVTRDSSVRLIRDGVVVHEGKLDVLRRFKDDVKEVQTGYECGITLENFNDIKEGDLIESYIMQEIPRV